jgi:hypothetical protein
MYCTEVTLYSFSKSVRYRIQQLSAEVERRLLEYVGGGLTPRWGINDRVDATPPFLLALRITLTLHDRSSSNEFMYAHLVL